MKKRILAILLLAGVLILTGCKSNEYKQAAELAQNGDYDSAITAYQALGDYKDSPERAIVMEVKALMQKYQDFYDNFQSLSMSNYDTELSGLEDIMDEFRLFTVSTSTLSDYSDLQEYVNKVAKYNDGFKQLMELDRDSIQQFLGPSFYMFPSTLALSISQSETMYRSWLKDMLDTEFPEKYTDWL